MHAAPQAAREVATQVAEELALRLMHLAMAYSQVRGAVEARAAWSLEGRSVSMGSPQHPYLAFSAIAVQKPGFLAHVKQLFDTHLSVSAVMTTLPLAGPVCQAAASMTLLPSGAHGPGGCFRAPGTGAEPAKRFAAAACCAERGVPPDSVHHTL